MGEYGGAAFLLVYLICIVLAGMPVLLSELVIGRSTGGNSVTAYEDLTDNKIGRKVGSEENEEEKRWRRGKQRRVCPSSCHRCSSLTQVFC